MKKRFGTFARLAFTLSILLAACQPPGPSSAEKEPSHEPAATAELVATLAPVIVEEMAGIEDNPAGFGHVPEGLTPTAVVSSPSPEVVSTVEAEGVASMGEIFVAPTAEDAIINNNSEDELQREDLSDSDVLAKYDSMVALIPEVAKATGLKPEDITIDYRQNALKDSQARWTFVFTSPEGDIWSKVSAVERMGEYPTYWAPGTNRVMNSLDGVTWELVEGGEMIWLGTTPGLIGGRGTTDVNDTAVAAYSRYIVPVGLSSSDLDVSDNWETITGVDSDEPAQEVILNSSKIGFALGAPVDGYPELTLVTDIVPAEGMNAEKVAEFEIRTNPETYGFNAGEVQMVYVPTEDGKGGIELRRTSNLEDVIAVFGNKDFVWKTGKILSENDDPVFLNAGQIVDMNGRVTVDINSADDSLDLLNSLNEVLNIKYDEKIKNEYFVFISKDGKRGVLVNFRHDIGSKKGILSFMDKDKKTVRWIYVEDFDQTLSFIEPLHR